MQPGAGRIRCAPCRPGMDFRGQIAILEGTNVSVVPVNTNFMIRLKHALLAVACAAIPYFSFAQADEEAAIRQVLEKESATWRSGDREGHASCWSIRPYSKIVFTTADGTTFDIDPKVIVDPPEGMMGRGGTSRNTNYLMHVSGNSAWVTHNEESIAPDGTSSFTFEFRMLEKEDGQWKLVGQSIHPLKAE